MQEVAAGDVPIERILNLVCERLGMKAAFIGRISEGRRTICYVGGDSLERGASDPTDESYCQLIVDGDVPMVIPDVTEFPRLVALEATQALGVRSHIGLPVRLSDGTLYGTLCAYGVQANPTLSTHDIRLLELVADIVSDRLEEDVRVERERNADMKVFSDLLARGQPDMVFQPIVDIASGEPIGFEALARFDTVPYRSPDQWFEAAIAVGLGLDLEVQAVTNALREASSLPTACYITVNASPELIMSRRLLDVLATTKRELVVEVTEHEKASKAAMAGCLRELCDAGYRIAMDDVGSGHSGLSRLVEVKPSIIKLDRDLISGIDRDVVRRSLVSAVVAFASSTGGTLVAEGVESEAEALTVNALGVRYGQGYHFARPAPAQVWRASTSEQP